MTNKVFSTKIFISGVLFYYFNVCTFSITAITASSHFYAVNEGDTRCPTPECILRRTSSSRFKHSMINQIDELARRKRDILSEIKTASSNRLDKSDKKRLSSSFSQGYIDLGSRNPKEEGAATLAFVFDTTGSMYDDLKQVIEGAGKILRTVLEKFERPIHDYILVPFNDPDIGKMTMTSDPEEFKSSLHELQYFIQGGGDCPEMAVGAIKMALEVCLPSSYIYVFTDARAKDYYLLDDVLRLIQKKHTQVIFVMTGDCGNQTHPGYQAFETIASTSSGQVFHLDKSDVDEVLNFVRLSLESRKVNLLSVDRQINQPGEENIELLVDKTLKEFTISIAGEKPTIEIYRPEGQGKYSKEDQVDELLTLENVKIVGVKKPIPGRYNISVGSDSKYTVRATGLSSIDFQTGFSLNPTNTIKETYHRPMKGAKTHVLVKPLDETEFGDLYRLQLISLNGEPLVDIPLRKLPGKDPLFTGLPITAPEQPFNVKIFGRDKDGFEFERISPTAITSQLPSPPEVVAEEKIIGFYDREVTITCQVQTLVPFNITWKKNSEDLLGPLQYPQSAEIKYSIESPTSFDEGFYSCSVTNIAGTEMAEVFLDIKEPPPEIQARGNESLTPGRRGVITCDVTSTVDFNVSWAVYVVKGQVQDFFGKIETVGDFVAIDEMAHNFVQLENNSLLIEEVLHENSGWYRCTATNEGGSRSKEVFVEVQALPEISVDPETLSFVEGTNITLKCNARGSPPLRVFWKKENKYLTNILPRINIDGNKTLLIQDALLEDEGQYTCIAKNLGGEAEDTSSIVFVEPARIVAVDKEILAESGSAVVLHCYAFGTPPPTVRWFKEDSSEVIAKSFLEIDGGHIRITGVQESDAGTYTCQATNGIGTSEDKITLSIGSAPSVLQQPTDQNIEIGGVGGLSCYGNGIPQPTITWSKKDGQPLPPNFHHDGSGTLRITGMNFEDEGVYVCLLKNIYGQKKIETKLTVSGLLPPLIAAPLESRIEALAPEPVTLPCTVVMATPPPTFQWYFRGRPLKLKDGMFITREGDLRIPIVHSRHRGSYKCIATNIAGNASLSLHLNVLERPTIREERLQGEIKALEGQRVRLKCPVKADPKPIYSWQKNGQPVMPFQRRMRITTDGTLIIRSTTPQDRGVYVCTAVNAAGATNTAVKLQVHEPPTIKEDLDILSVIEGEEMLIPCRVRGFPSPEIKWIKIGEPDLDLNSTTMPDGSLRVYGSLFTESTYECWATNEAGTVSRTVTLIVNKEPVISKVEDEDIEVVEGENMKLTCQVTGYPKPHIVWTRNEEELVLSDTVRFIDDYLLIRNISANFKGTYTCRAENRVGFDSKVINVDVKYPPQEIMHTRIDKTLIEGSSATLPCPSSGNPPPTKTWSVDGKVLGPGNRIFFESDGTLEIEGAKRHHSGTYMCTLSNQYGEANLTYIVEVMVPPKVSRSNEEIRPEVVEGNEVKIKCPVDAFPIPTVEWLKDGVSIFSTKDRADVTHIIIEENGQTLHIFEATMDDQGAYKCIVRNSAGETSMDFILKVLVAPHFTTFLHDPQVIAYEGEEVVLDCSANGDPEPKLVWERNGFKLPPLYPQVSPDGKIIRIARVTESDAGLYTCTAANSAGFAARNFSLTVYAHPMIDSPSGRPEKEVIAVMGQDTKVQCQASGAPDPTISWTFDGIPIELAPDLKFSLYDNDQVLTLHSLSPENSGTYVCNATNIVGSSIKEFNISVFMPPFIGTTEDFVTEMEKVETQVDEELNLSCDGGGFPPPRYSWFWNDRPLSPSIMSYQIDGTKLLINRVRLDHSGIFTCLLVNPAGTAEKHFDIAVNVPATIGNEVGTGRNNYKEFPVTVEATANAPFSIYCPAFGIPEPKIIWSKDGERIDTIHHWQKISVTNTTTTNVTNNKGISSKDVEQTVLKKVWSERIHLTDKGKRLIFDAATTKDSGIYTCTAENKAGSDSMDSSVLVLDAPKVVKRSPSPLLIQEDYPLKLYCQFKGTPTPIATWLFNGADLNHLPIEGVVTKKTNENEIILNVDHIANIHVGTYTCIISSIAGTDEATFDVSVATLPKSVDRSRSEAPEIVTTKANRPVTFECRVESFPPPVFQWLFNGSPIDASDDRYHLTSDKSSLQILIANPQDSGKYSCLAANSVGYTTQNFSLNVHVPPHLKNPVNEEVSAEEGEFTELVCPIDATPTPSILWMKDSVILNRHFTSRDPKHLIIRNASREDQGRYTCIATNEAGTLEQSFTVNVLVPPKLENENKAILEEKVVINRQVAISCFVVAESDLEIIWRKDGKVISEDANNRTTFSSLGRRINIAQVRLEDAGDYTCSATNDAGQINTTTTLIVLSPPIWAKNASSVDEIVGVKDQELLIDCSVDGSPPPNLIWLKGGKLIMNDSGSWQFDAKHRTLLIFRANEKDAGRYSCIASNAAGTLEKNILVSVHQPPSLTHLPSKNVQVLKNRPVHLHCPIKGKPIPDITWTMDGELLDENSELIQYSNRKREIHILRASGSGNVSVICFANNSIGVLETEFLLEVLSAPVILPAPANPLVSAVEGVQVQLQCDASGYPTPQAFWAREDGTLFLPEEASSHGIQIENDGQSLTIPDIRADQQGEYICTAVNKGGLADFSFNVLVNLPPEIQRPLDDLDTIVNVGSFLVLKCDVAARPKAVIKWYKNGDSIHPSQDPFIYMTNDDQRLRFSRVLARHGGVYSCTATNEAGHDKLQFKVQVLRPPSINKNHNSALEIYEGETMELECKVEGEPLPIVTWQKGEIILTPSSRIEFTSDQNLFLFTLANVTVSDAGDYACKATSQVGSAKVPFHVDIYKEPVISDKIATDQAVILSRSHILECNAEGSPDPIISWTRRGSSIDRFMDPNIQLSSDRKKLTIARAKESDGGFYTCVASSIAGQDSETFSLSVQVPPAIQRANQPSNVMAIAGKWTELVCEASGNPKPHRAWKKHQQTISATDRIQISDGGSHLRVSRLESSDSGVYTCEAENIAGIDIRNITLQVMVPPQLSEEAIKKIRAKEGTNAIVHCPVEAYPEPSFTWKKGSTLIREDGIGNLEIRDSGRILKIVRIDGSDAAVYECTASNSAGSIQYTVDVEVVVPPMIAGVKGMGDIIREQLKVIDGGHVTFECHLLQGQPTPTRSWSKGDDQDLVNHTISGAGDTMIIFKTTVEDSGIFQCEAQNEFGRSVKLFELIVQTSPKVNITSAINQGLELEGEPPVPLPPDGRPRQSSVKTSLRRVKGDTIKIICPIEGIPDPRILWYKGSHALIPSPRYIENKRDLSLTILNAMPSDSGKFACVGVNPAGEAEVSIVLAIEDRPLILGDPNIVLPAVVGQSVSMDCKIEQPRSLVHKRSYDISWSKDGNPLLDQLTSSSRDIFKKIVHEESVNDFYNPSYPDESNSSSAESYEDRPFSYILARDSSKLTIPRIKDGVQGEYECKASNKAGFSTKKFHIDILTAPTIDTLEEIRIFEAAVGEPVVFECNASGQPPPEISWYKEGHPVQTSSRFQFLESSHVLIIQAVQEEDEGQYTCYASNAAGMTTETFSLTVLVPPRLIGKVEERTEVVSGQSVDLNCPMGGTPVPEVVWSFENKVLYPEGDIIRRIGDSLHIEKVTPDLAGEYVCDGTNAVGRTFKIIHLIVKESPVISGSNYEEIETVIEGDAATLHCLASGQPLPIIQWEKEGVGVRLSSRVSISWGGRTLLIQNVKMKDAGRYTCSASNSAGNDTRQYKLNVLQPPKIEEGPSNIVAIEGEVITVFCSVTGSPTPKMLWYHNEEVISQKLNELDILTNQSFSELPEELQKEMSQGPSRGILGSGAMQFSPVLPEHSGNYSCVADNEAGRARHTFSLSVLLPPEAYLEISPALATTGEEVNFLCKVEGSQPIVITWLKGNTPLRPGIEFQFGTNGTLKAPSVTLEMAGTYSCSVKNAAGSDEASESLIVQEIPKVSAVTKEIIVAEGQDVELSCRVHGEPTPSVTWSRPDLGGQGITPEDTRVQLLENSLSISQVMNEDMGTYRCTGTNRAGSDHANLALVVTSVPKILEEIDDKITVVLGESISLSCTAVSGYPPPSIIWRKEGRRLNSNPRIKLATNGELFIENITEEDSGMYSCLVVNAAGRLYRVVTVVVQVPPRLLLLPTTQEVTLGDGFYLECEAVGVPVPTISWLLNGNKVEGASSSFGGRGRLDIQRAAKSDEGTYTCLAENSAGHRKAVAAIRVKVPPIIMSSPGEMTVQELSSVMLTCLAEGDPYPVVTWTKEGHYIAASERVHIMKNGSLMIDTSKGSDAGKYKCVVSNDAGAAEAVSHLRVMMPPKIIKAPLSVDVEVGDTVRFDCEADGEPHPQTQWSIANKDMNSRFKILTNGSLQLIAAQFEDEGHVICQVFNDLGEDLAKASISVRVPGMWGEWGPWNSCSSTCGSGVQIRRRFCDSPAPKNGGKSCQGEDKVERPCRLKACPIDGKWSLWENWSECSVSCGGGTRIRNRVCNNPAPMHDGKSCEGPSVDEEKCQIQDCPVNGNWSEWSNWTDCSRTCGEALRQRTRICNNPPPSNGGAFCEDNNLEVIPCENEACAIHGNWGNWDDWSTCSSPCGKSVRYRKRRCNNPIPENGGDECLGESYEEQSCDVPSCIVHGGWSSWSGWGSCSATCGRGHRERNRECNNPEPKEGGQKCGGPDTETQPCSLSPCPVHGNWGVWSAWSSCSKTCGSGIRERSRRCNNPYPRNGGDTCKGSATETIICEDLSCKDLPIRAYGTLRGYLNGEDLGVISLAGNVTTNGNQRTLVVSLSPLLPQYATWLTPLISVVSSAIWSSAFEADDAKNGNSLAKSTFTRQSKVTFGNGEQVDISQTAKGIDETGTLRFNVEVDGDVPYLQPGSFVSVQPFSEDYIQTGKGALYVKSSRTFAVSGFHHPYTWNETIDYDPSNGFMPTMVQTLHANSVSASYRCMAGIEGSNSKGELSIMISSVIMPSSDDKCPFGFTLTDTNETTICQDNNECDAEDTLCSHFCKNIVGGYLCDCPHGYQIGKDEKTCEDVNECVALSPPCNPREECINSPGSYTCKYSCGPGFRMTSSSGTACEDIDECQVDEPCEQDCLNLVGSYSCNCFRGFTLHPDGRCVDIDECVLYGAPCSHQCTNTPGSFKCSCPDGYQLLNNGRCKDIDECSTFQHNCSIDEICRNEKGGFKCATDCPTGLIMASNGSCVDIDECSHHSLSCHYTQRCENMWGTFRCSCQKGYKTIGPGHPCIDINECQNSPRPCNYECRNLMGDYECICPPGMRRLRNRKTCVALQYDEEYRAPLSHSYRFPRPQRHPPPGYSATDYQQRLLKRVYRITECPEGFVSKDDDCEDLNECSKPGRCQHACKNTYGSFHCLCPPGYQLMDNDHSCKDLNECSENEDTCRSEQLCVNVKGSFKCEDIECPLGYVKGPRKGFCEMDCRSRVAKCPSGVQRNHYIIYEWISVSSGVLAFEDIVKLSPIDRKGNLLPHSEFSVHEQETGDAFAIRQQNGVGILSTLKNLKPGKDYRLVIEAYSYDAELNFIKYSTRFVVVLYVSEYPY